MTYVCQLPNAIQAELLTDCDNILRDNGYSETERQTILDNVKTEKLINVIGHKSDLTPNYDKYAKYL